MLSEISESQKDTYCMISLYEAPRVVKCIGQEVEWWLLGAGRRGNAELLFNGYRVSVLQDEKVLEIAQQCEYT